MASQLRINGLSNIVLDRELEALFTTHGTVVEARIIHDPATGLGSGAGMVEMRSEPEATAAATALDGFEYMGRPLSVTRRKI